jgi:hypothetical protein
VIDAEVNTVLLRWQYDHENISCFKIFKSINGSESFSLYKIVGSSDRQLKDRLIPNLVNRYKIMGVLQDGVKSSLSDQLQIEF